MYTPWKKLLDPSIQCYPIELAGRGRRFQTPLYANMAEAVEDVVSILKPHLGTSKFAFFGHSMGALLCYEVIETLWREYSVTPLQAFLSARTPPNNPTKKILHTLPDQALGEQLFQWGGLSPQLYTNKEFMGMFLPIIRADLKVVETYKRENMEYPRLPCTLSILAGKEDMIAPMEQMLPWENFTTHACDFHTFEGGHFYLLEHSSEVVQLINTTLGHISAKYYA